MTTDSDSPRPAIYWLVDELLALWKKNRKFDVAREFLSSVDDFESKILLSALFWRAMQDADWELGDQCLGAGYSLASEDSSDFGPLYHAMSLLGDRPDVIEWLLRHGAKIEQRGHNNWTPLLAAASAGFDKTAKVLLEGDADVNASTEIDDDMTPLMAAAAVGNTDLAELLMRYGADRDRLNRRNQSAAMIADAHGYAAFADWVRGTEKDRKEGQKRG